MVRGEGLEPPIMLGLNAFANFATRALDLISINMKYIVSKIKSKTIIILLIIGIILVATGATISTFSSNIQSDPSQKAPTVYGIQGDWSW